MDVTESKAEFFDDMSHERDGLEAGLPGRKNCLCHDSNIPEHPNLSCECAGDNGGEDKTQIAK